MTVLSLRERARLRFHGERAPSIEEQIADLGKPAKREPKAPKPPAPRPLITGPTDAPVVASKAAPRCKDCGAILMQPDRGPTPKRCAKHTREHELEHRRERNRKYKAERRQRTKVHQKTCATCNKGFETKNSFQVCCSAECSHLRRLQKQRDARKADRSYGRA